MKKLLMGTIGIGLVLSVSSAMATPALQLGILGGTYDTLSETTVSNGDVFQLYAYLIVDNDNLLNDTYYISAALTPKVQREDGGDYGSFTFNGDPVAVTDDMVYGTPPVDRLYPNLPSHDIFNTYYKEFSFRFEAENYSGEIPNVQDATEGVKPGYFASFDIDTSLVAADYEIHFDLYNENLITKRRHCADYSIEFAPFSHDAESGGGHSVPEPQTMFLFGTGLVGLAVISRRKKIH